METFQVIGQVGFARLFFGSATRTDGIYLIESETDQIEEESKNETNTIGDNYRGSFSFLK